MQHKTLVSGEFVRLDPAEVEGRLNGLGPIIPPFFEMETPWI